MQDVYGFNTHTESIRAYQGMIIGITEYDKTKSNLRS